MKTPPPPIGKDDERDTSSGAVRGMAPVGNRENRAHLVNRGALEEQALAGPGSLDPRMLRRTDVIAARRWLAKLGVEMLIPLGWKYMGIAQDQSSLSFNSTGGVDGHGIELTVWPLPDDVAVEKLLAEHKESAAEAQRLKRLTSWRVMRLGDIDGVVQLAAGPDDQESLAAADPEELFLATEGTGRRVLSWRGAVRGDDESRLFILALTGPIDTFMEARAVFEALLEKCAITAPR